jgi:hypothetical protein
MLELLWLFLYSIRIIFGLMSLIVGGVDGTNSFGNDVDMDGGQAENDDDKHEEENRSDTESEEESER